MGKQFRRRTTHSAATPSPTQSQPRPWSMCSGRLRTKSCRTTASGPERALPRAACVVDLGIPPRSVPSGLATQREQRPPCPRSHSMQRVARKNRLVSDSSSRAAYSGSGMATLAAPCATAHASSSTRSPRSSAPARLSSSPPRTSPSRWASLRRSRGTESACYVRQAASGFLECT